MLLENKDIIMRIAIIGSGISGNGIAYLLHKKYDITVYEKNDYIGGHSRTAKVKTSEGAVPVDTGFIVYNERNYPHLTGLFKHLKVPTTKSDMSFGVSINDGWLEYGTYNKIMGMFAQKSNLLRPNYWKFILDILRFNKNATQYLKENTKLTLGELLDEMKMGTWFQNHYLLAMGAAIWSTPTNKMLDFPARTFLQFFDNHGLLTINDHPQWRTVTGGSKEYVKRITEPFKDKIKLNSAVINVTREKEGVRINDIQGGSEIYDKVIFACHSDQVMKLLQNPTDKEQKTIGAIKYQPNEMILHTDQSFMPKRKKAWSSWVYLSEASKDTSTNVSLSYWMNNLQPLKTETPIIVTLNPGRDPDPNLIHDRYNFEHPVFDASAIQAQKDIESIQGENDIYYCGAWLRYGFHEDGILSAVNVAKHFGITPPWN